MRRVTVVERGRLIRGADSELVGENADDTPFRRTLPSRLYDRLLRLESAREDRGEGAVFKWRRSHCLVGPWVGVMQIPGLQVEILPKTDDREDSDDELVADTRLNLMEMLLRGGLGAVRARGRADVSLRRGSLHDQLVDAFLDRVLHELRRGLDRSYLAHEANLATLRGKLVLSRHIARNSARKHRFYCRHDVLSEATPVTLRLKQACRVIAGRPVPARLQGKCQQALALLADVSEESVNRRGRDPVFNRQNQRFEDIYAFACMLLEGRAPDARAGDVETFSLLFDMEQVFERYIAAFIASHVVSRVPGVSLFPQAKGHRLSLFRDGSATQAKEILRLAPDLLFLREGHDTRRALIVDTKWKRLSRDRAARPKNADLYQLYAYLNRYDCQRAFLLYPQTEGVTARDLDALIGQSGHTQAIVGVRLVDLRRHLWTNEGRAALATELEALVREGFGVAANSVESAAAAAPGGVA